MAALGQSQESRRIKRHSAAWRGTINCGGNRKPVTCVVRDFSNIGAQLLTAEGASCPETFLLRISNSSKMFRCQVMWRDGKTLGVKFIGTRPRWNP